MLSFQVLVTVLPILSLAATPSFAHQHASEHRHRHRSVREKFDLVRKAEQPSSNQLSAREESFALYDAAMKRAPAEYRVKRRVVAGGSKLIRKDGKTCKIRTTSSTQLVSATTTDDAPTPTQTSTSTWASASASASSSDDWSDSEPTVSAQAQINVGLGATATSSSTWSSSSSTKKHKSSSTSSSSTAQPTSGGGSSGSSSSGLLQITDPTCGYSNADSSAPNGVETWLNCGLTGSGWTPPFVTMDELIAVDLDANGIYSNCAAYFDFFNAAGAQYGIKPILLAAFAQQESGCDPNSTGPNGEIGLMQVTPENCADKIPSGENWYDPSANVYAGAAVFADSLSSTGGNAVEAAGQYNGWYRGMTEGDVYQASCNAQQNMDYLEQLFNGWILGRSTDGLGTIQNKNC